MNLQSILGQIDTLRACEIDNPDLVSLALARIARAMKDQDIRAISYFDSIYLLAGGELYRVPFRLSCDVKNRVTSPTDVTEAQLREILEGAGDVQKVGAGS